VYRHAELEGLRLDVRLKVPVSYLPVSQFHRVDMLVRGVQVRSFFREELGAPPSPTHKQPECSLAVGYSAEAEGVGRRRKYAMVLI
jgi:hypothetical protein